MQLPAIAFLILFGICYHFHHSFFVPYSDAQNELKISSNLRITGGNIPEIHQNGGRDGYFKFSGIFLRDSSLYHSLHEYAKIESLYSLYVNSQT